MLTTESQVTKSVIFGLDAELADELRTALFAQNQAVLAIPSATIGQCLDLARGMGAEVLFCPSNPLCYRPLLRAVRMHSPDLPVVVVSRQPNAPQWVDAMESGAADYCSAPFEPVQLRWVLETASRSRAVAA